MNRLSNFTPFSTRNRHPKTAKGAADFLRAHDKMSSLLPALERLAALQKDCSALLPSTVQACPVLQYEAGQLILAAPNSALAARLKQQLPRLQDGLLKRGWQIDAIRIKLQVVRPAERYTPSKQISLPRQALSSLATLEETLEDSPRNGPLKAAIAAMVRRHLMSK
jgi:hypothetical protein